MNEQEYDAAYEYGAEVGALLIEVISNMYDIMALKTLSASFGYIDAVNEALENFLKESIQ